MEKVKAEELLSRFRSKEDLYRYMTQQGKHIWLNMLSDPANVFLPSMAQTRLSFLRDILSDKKKHLRNNEVNRMEVPNYQELSVKNMYPDAMQDAELSKYLPSSEQLSGKLPERDFFFGILCTLKNGYMCEVIADAQKKRFKVEEGDDTKKVILISESWLAELKKHPYHSSKSSVLMPVGKPGTGVFLLKESAKLYKVPKERTSHMLSKRLSNDVSMQGASQAPAAIPDKRMKDNNGKMIAPTFQMMKGGGGSQQ